MYILLVEDELLIRFILAELLTEAGFDVREAEDGDQAAAVIETTPADLVLLVTDIHMPGDRNGIDVAQLLRARRPDIPVIYTTGRPDVLDKPEHFGANDVLVPKPYAPSELLAVVRRLLAREECRDS